MRVLHRIAAAASLLAALALTACDDVGTNFHGLPTLEPTVDANGPDTAIDAGEMLAVLESQVARHGLEARPPLPAAEIDRLTAELPCPLPPLLRRMYAWHDGVEQLAPPYDFLPLGELMESSRWQRKAQQRHPVPGGWKDSYLPAFTFDHDVDLVIDCAPDARNVVRSYDAEAGEDRVAYRGLGHFLAVTVAAYEAGAYRVRDEYHDANPIRLASAHRRYALPNELAAMEANWQTIAARLRTADTTELRLLESYEASYADARTIALLRGRLRESNADLVATAAFMLGRLHAQEALPDLTELLAHPSPAVRNLAASAIANLDEIDASTTIDRLLVQLGDSNDMARISAIEALSTARSRRAVPALLELLAKSRPGIQAYVVSALGRIGDPAALPALRELQAKLAGMDLSAPDKGGTRGSNPPPQRFKAAVDAAIAAIGR